MLEVVLRREKTITAVGLMVLVGLAWFYLWSGAGMGMPASAMTRLALFPHLTPEPMPNMVMPPLAWLTVVLMWWVMMIAMMTPSATPLVLLFARMRHHYLPAQSRAARMADTTLLLAGYLLAWFLFSVLAAAVQWQLQHLRLISPMMLWSQNQHLSAIVLFAAGLYQFSPLKFSCLQHCRSPVQFLTRHWRASHWGTLRMGVLHGAWCVGCCWILMALLFVGGVMNVVWIAGLSMLVLIEKLSSNGVVAGRVIGGVLIGWGLLTLLQ